LLKVIAAAKHMYYNEVIRNSENKIKSTWKIINEEKGKTRSRPIIQFLKTNNNEPLGTIPEPGYSLDVRPRARTIIIAIDRLGS